MVCFTDHPGITYGGAVSPRDGAADFLILPVMTAVAMKVFLDELASERPA